VPIPFHLGLEVDGYLGFRFERLVESSGNSVGTAGAAA
jgi:hypothetical protein